MSDKGLSPPKKLQFTPVRVAPQENDDHLNEIDRILEKAMLTKQEQEKEKQNSEEDRKKEAESTHQNTIEEEKSVDGSKISQDQLISVKKKRCPLIEGCNSINNYERLNYIHEGVYGMVFRAKDKQTGEIYAIKKVKLSKEKEGFPITSIREINLLLGMNHPNIVNVQEVVMADSLENIFVVMEYVEHELKDLMDHTKYTFSTSEIKSLMKQLLQAIEYLHNHNIMHRDLKTSNLLYSNKGLLKVCDFGLARKFLGSKRSYTPVVVTLWYRAPEVLLGCDQYTPAIDMWSVGCIFAELVLKEPLLKAQSEIEQIDVIFRTLGNPTSTTWPGWKELRYARNLQPKNYFGSKLPEIFLKNSFIGEACLSENGLDLLAKMLYYDPSKRITATEALKHPWFKEGPPAQDIELMPTFPAMNDVSRELRKKKF